MRFVPHTRAGHASCALGTAFLALFVLLQALVRSGQEGGDTFADNLLLFVAGELVGGE